jgi:pimeloyl-ACP methyl ester carboxylesterase
MSRRVRVAAAVAAALVVLLVGGFYAWTRVARYAAFPEAVAVAEAAERVRGWTVFAPDGEPIAGFVFYPGGLVDPVAYAPWLQRLADGGVLAVLVPMPLDLAVFGIGRAADVIAAFPEVDTWAIGGHSLGGAMAAEFVKGGAAGVDGIVLLASFPAESTDLSALAIRAVSTYGSENGLTPPEGFEASMVRLPPGSELVEIEGGNHAGFGHYGPQAGDGVPAIDREEQQRQAAETVLAFLRDLR